MDNITYDVRIWRIETCKGARSTTYKVRWRTGTRRWKKAFQTKAQAASFEAELRSAASRGEAFDTTTGRPVSWGRQENDMSWYDFCVSYVDMKWKRSAGKRRATIAWALVTVMPAMIATSKGKPDDKAVRAALRQWGFNAKRRAECPPDTAVILTWLSRNTKPVTTLNDPTVMRTVLDAAATQLNGQPSALWTARTNNAILANAIEYAIELRILSSNPIKELKWKAPKTTQEVDRRSVVNPGQARQLLEAVRGQTPSGSRLVAFFGVVYYAALRPEEAVNLRWDNVTLPPLVRNATTGEWEEPADNWGELRFCSAAPEVGSEWTDDGARREQRQQLKSRPVGEWRVVPVPPPLTRLLRTHLKEFGTGPTGRVFSGVHGAELASITYRRAWDKARHAVLTSAEHQRDCTIRPCQLVRASPLARRVYDLRHACVSTWLNGGVAPAQVAEWAGHSVAVLLKVYAKCIDGQDQVARRRIEDALGDPGVTGNEPGAD
jgi:integrase